MLPSLENLATRWRQPFLGLITIGLLLLTFGMDLLAPVEIAVWALYSVSILTALWWRGQWAVMAVTILAIGLTILGAWPVSDEDLGMALVNRVFAVVMMSVVGWLCVRLDRQQADHKRAEEKLLESEVRLTSVVQSAVDAIILADNNGNVVSWNKAAATTFGYREQEMVGKPLTQLIPERYREAHRRGLERVRSTGESRLVGQTVELQGLRKDGSEFPLELSLATWKTKGENYFSGIIRDISDRKRADNRLAAQLAVSLALVDSDTLREAAPRFLRAVCDIVGWELGVIWLIDHDAQVLRCDLVWHVPSVNAAEFIALSRETTFSSGIGLPGRVWASGEPAWIPNVLKDSNFPRARLAAKAGLHGAFGFPIKSRGETLGVIEFFSRDIRPPDTSLLQMMADIGIKIGQFIERSCVEQERKGLLLQLQDAVGNIKTLRGLLPICASCKRIRDDKGYWNQVEDYIKDRSEAVFTHGVCDECARKEYPDWDNH